MPVDASALQPAVALCPAAFSPAAANQQKRLLVYVLPGTFYHTANCDAACIKHQTVSVLV